MAALSSIIIKTFFLLPGTLLINTYLECSEIKVKEENGDSNGSIILHDRGFVGGIQAKSCCSC